MTYRYQIWDVGQECWVASTNYLSRLGELMWAGRKLHAYDCHPGYHVNDPGVLLAVTLACRADYICSRRSST